MDKIQLLMICGPVNVLLNKDQSNDCCMEDGIEHKDWSYHKYVKFLYYYLIYLYNYYIYKKKKKIIY